MSVAIIERCDAQDIRDILSRAILLENVPNAEERLKRWLRTSEKVWLGMHDDKVACVWGLVPASTISDRAYLWLLTTDIVDEHKFIFVRHSQLMIEEALKHYPHIVGHVEIHNERAKRWLRWLGATFSEPVGGYLPFIIRRK